MLRARTKYEHESEISRMPFLSGDFLLFQANEEEPGRNSQEQRMTIRDLSLESLHFVQSEHSKLCQQRLSLAEMNY